MDGQDNILRWIVSFLEGKEKPTGKRIRPLDRIEATSAASHLLRVWKFRMPALQQPAGIL